MILTTSIVSSTCMLFHRPNADFFDWNEHSTTSALESSCMKVMEDLNTTEIYAWFSEVSSVGIYIYV